MITLPAIEIRRVQSIAEYSDAKTLILAYVEWLGFDLKFQNFDQEMQTLPEMYSQQNGGLFVGYANGAAVGVAGLRRFGDNDGEVKRMYVRPEGRGLGLGKLLLQTCIDTARNLKYDTVKLDTAEFMKSAITLYTSFGFVEIPAYRFNPHQHARYFELKLS